MIHSLRWRLALGFALAVLLAVGLTGLLALSGTTRRFGVLISEDGIVYAEALAPLLAAEYAYWGDWEAVATQRIGREFDMLEPPDNFFIMPLEDQEYDWGSAQECDMIDYVRSADFEIDTVPFWLQKTFQDNWVRQIFKTGDYWDQDMLEYAVPGQSLIDIIDNAQDADQFIQNIIDEETININNALSMGFIDEEEAAFYLGSLRDEVYNFMYNTRFQGGNDINFSFVSAPQLTVEGSNWLLESLLFSEERLLVADVEGRVVIDSDDEVTGEMLDAAALAVGAPVYDINEGKQIGTVLVGAEIGLYDAQQRAFLDGVYTTMGLSAALGGLAALALGFVIAQQITRPVRALTHAAERMTAGDLDQRVPVSSQDELGQMSQAFNRLANEISTQRMLRSRLVDDIAHELNTPLSLMQLEIQAMLDNLQSPEEAAGQMRRELDELHTLVADLAYLADPDAAPAITLAPVDINTLVTEVCTRFMGQAEACGVTLTVEPCDASPTLQLDPVRIGQALSNMLKNALQHTASGGSVSVSVHCAPDTVSVMVRDTGVGISEDDLPYVWERFYRSDRARSRDTGGRGLGLAIARQAVELHTGQVWAKSVVGEGSEFGFTLPVHPVHEEAVGRQS